MKVAALVLWVAALVLFVLLLRFALHWSNHQ